MIVQAQVQAVKDKMSERRYSVLHEFHSFTGEVVQINFVSLLEENKRKKSDPDPSIGVSVYFDNDQKEYKIDYILPNSMNFLSTPNYCSFFNDKIFEGLESKLWLQARILEHYQNLY